MAENAEKEVYRLLQESQRKYTYFLLASAGAAIGFILNQTSGQALSLSHLPLGFALIAWGASFFCGCRYVSYINSSLYSNTELLKVQKGDHPDIGNHPDKIKAASEGIRSAIESNADKANTLGHWQFRLLIIGALFLAHIKSDPLEGVIVQ